MDLIFTIEAEDVGKRLDNFLHQEAPQYSRSRLQDWIKQGHAQVNGHAQKPSYTLRAADRVSFTPGEIPALHAYAEDLPLEILYSDPDVVVVNKPAGLVVHSGAGRQSGTLVNALLHHFQALSTVGGQERPGIVHRLDRETSGVLVVARNDIAHRHLAEQFASRHVEKVYLALVQGQLASDSGRITSKIARDPVRRVKMTTRLETGRTALSDYKVRERLPLHTFVEIRIGTGRTHQIRVHMSSIGHPVAGDVLYGAKAAGRGRFFLHAHRLSFSSPSTGKQISIEAPLPAELVEWLRDARNAADPAGERTSRR